jgi:GxxExxY protein
MRGKLAVVMAEREDPERGEEGVWVSVHTGCEDGVLATVEAAAKEVFDILGSGHHESIYRNALSLELRSRGHRCDNEVPICVSYKGFFIGFGRADIIVRTADVNVVLELKSVSKLTHPMEGQVRAYTRSLSGSARAVLINFGHSDVEVRSVVV